MRGLLEQSFQSKLNEKGDKNKHSFIIILNYD